jgi:predicted Fe-S protein YdhL (DUF1289 family)
MFEEPVVESPCINVCSMNDKTGYCHGCYRTIEEIQAWWDLTFEQKTDVIKKTWARQEAAFGDYSA